MKCPVSYNRIKEWTEHLPLFFRFRGSVSFVIFPQVVLGVFYSFLVVMLHKYTDNSIPEFPTSFIPILGLIIGLLLVFRTTTGYDRYYEGRKLWSDISYRIRTLTRCTWLGVNDEGQPNILIEKKTALNLLVAFAYATKNYLRGEYSYDEDTDIQRLTSHLPRFQQEEYKEGTKEDITSRFSSQETLEDTNEAHHHHHVVAVSSQKNLSIELPEDIPHNYHHQHETTNNAPAKREMKKENLSKVTMSVRRRVKQKSTSKEKMEVGRRGSTFQAHDEIPPTNIPIELLYYFQTWVYKVMKDKIVDGETAKIMLAFTNDLSNILAQLERILRTPIPLAYSIHLHQSIWLYMLSLPFQIVHKLGWITVPAMALACFAYLGILAIGWEIENPFGYDDNDLPLDDFCDVIQHEVKKFSQQTFPESEVWTFNMRNAPFEQSHLSAVELMNLEPSQFHTHLNNKFCRTAAREDSKL